MGRRKELRDNINSLEKERLELLSSPSTGKNAEYAAIAISDIE